MKCSFETTADNEKNKNKFKMGNPDVSKPESSFGVRHLQAVLLFFAMTISFMMRVNMSMAIVSMTDKTNDNSFDWSLQIQSVILSSFFWGYVVLQVPGGMITSLWGGKILVIINIVVNSAVSLLLPIGAQYGGWQVVCCCRVLQGLTQGVLYPSVHHLIGKWAPLEEKNRLGTLIYAGAQFGTGFQLLISGFIADAWGWAGIFYVNGVLGAIWVLIYIFVGSASPKTSRLISAEEKNYIESSLGHIGEQKRLATPWKSIWTSLPFISLIVAHCGQNWGFWTLMTEIPSYMSQVLGVNIKSNGVMSALPYFAMYLMSFPLGYFSDLLIKKKWLNITATRKVSNSIGFFGPALALIGLSYSPAGNVTVAVALLTLVVGLNAGHYTGFLLVHIDLSPNFAGTLMGITNALANVISIIAPLVAGAIIQDETDPVEWRKVFYVSSGVYILSNLFFMCFGTCQKQSWNEPQEEQTTTGATDEGSSQETEKVV